MFRFMLPKNSSYLPFRLNVSTERTDPVYSKSIIIPDTYSPRHPVRATLCFSLSFAKEQMQTEDFMLCSVFIFLFSCCFTQPLPQFKDVCCCNCLILCFIHFCVFVYLPNPYPTLYRKFSP